MWCGAMLFMCDIRCCVMVLTCWGVTYDVVWMVFKHDVCRGVVVFRHFMWSGVMVFRIDVSCGVQMCHMMRCLGVPCGVVRSRRPTSRIVGGTATAANQFPWVVMLVENNRFICGGSILDPLHVVTAAHCVDEWEILPQTYITFFCVWWFFNHDIII